ncbi:MAG: sugar transferase [Alphaproteobacteria bacterium]|nr:sugar transferase [Alphaproteobacteria bacterium]
MIWIITLAIAFLGICIAVTRTERRLQRERNTYASAYNVLPMQKFSLFSCVVKRLTDIVVALLVCLSILPLLYIVLGIIIKLTSSGPIIFSQKRVGLFEKEFVCYKFRSMYLNSSLKIADKNDERVTPIGKFIRRTHLDEFPQFYNVLIGEMSLVGPRPMLNFAVDEFRAYPQYYLRPLLRPGITGPAQINSCRTLSSKRCSEYDIDYIRHRSWVKDIAIMIETLKFQDISY